MKINCLSCGHNIHLDDAYSDYEGEVKCFACGAVLDIKLDQGCIKKVKLTSLTRPVAPEP
jgi:hypothetical protein